MRTFTLCLTLVFSGVTGLAGAKEPPRTMATRKVVSAKAFAVKRAKALESKPKKKKQRTPKTKDPKSQWGVPEARAKRYGG